MSAGIFLDEKCPLCTMDMHDGGSMLALMTIALSSPFHEVGVIKVLFRSYLLLFQNIHKLF